MTVFIYDYTLDGLLSAIFDAYSDKIFPDLLVREGSQLPLPPTVLPKRPFPAFRTVPLLEHETSYFADSVSVLTFARIFSFSIYVVIIRMQI